MPLSKVRKKASIKKRKQRVHQTKLYQMVKIWEEINAEEQQLMAQQLKDAEENA